MYYHVPHAPRLAAVQGVLLTTTSTAARIHVCLAVPEHTQLAELQLPVRLQSHVRPENTFQNLIHLVNVLHQILTFSLLLIKECPSECMSCSSPSKCHTCRKNYVLNGNLCQKKNGKRIFFNIEKKAKL